MDVAVLSCTVQKYKQELEFEVHILRYMNLCAEYRLNNSCTDVKYKQRLFLKTD